MTYGQRQVMELVDRLRPADWSGPYTREQNQAILERLGLTRLVWTLP